MRATHTYAILEVSSSTYAEIETKLKAAEYDHAFHDDVIDMHGLALRGDTISSEPTDAEHPHLINGEFQSDKYPTTPRGKVPLSVKDPSAQDLLWEYAQRHHAVDAEFAADLEIALKNAGYVPKPVSKEEDFCR
jgi:hypothetical protein